MSTLVLKNGRVFDPSRKLDKVADVLIDQDDKGTIKAVRKSLKGDEEIDCKGLLVCPGFMDIHVHFREPGYTAKETIATGAAAAVHGGFAAVVVMPNTDPPLDNTAAIAYQYLQAKNAGKARVYPMGCISRGREGKEMADLGLLANAGAIAFTDDGSCVPNNFILRSAFEYLRSLGKVLCEHCEDRDLSQGAIMHEGKVSAALGINGYPSAAEEIIIARDIRLCKLADSRLHVQHVSAKGSVELIRNAKRKGVRVTTEVTPQHLLLTDETCRSFDPVYRMNPPMRETSDTAACLKGLLDGTIDCFVSDHAPHTEEEKSVEFSEAPNGMIGLESSIGVTLTKLVATKKIPLKRYVEAWTSGPARCFGLPGGSIKVGGPADLTVLDLNHKWTLDPSVFQSKGRNCPFKGWKLKGAPMWTVVNGKTFKAIGQTNGSE